MGKLKLNPPLRTTRQKPSNKNKKPNYKSKLGVIAKGVHKNNNKNKSKPPSLKNQIRSTQRLLQRDIPAELREAQEKKLEELLKQQLEQNRLAEEKKNFARDKNFRFFDRRKIERRMRRMEKQLRGSLNEEEEKKITEDLRKLKDDLEYVWFFPKTEKYVRLFSGDDDPDVVENISRLRMQIKENIIAAAASGKELEETGSEDDGPIDLTDDDFFVSGTSSDEADADDELTDLSAREQASRAPNKAALGMSNDETNQMQKSARSLMPPPQPQKSSTQRFDHSNPRNTKNLKLSHTSDSRFQHPEAGQSSNRISNSDFPKQPNDSRFQHGKAGQSSNRFSRPEISKQANDRRFRQAQGGQSSNRFSRPEISKQANDRRFRQAQGGESSNRNFNSDTPMQPSDGGFLNSQASQSSNISSNSDAPKRPRKRRPKKKKQ